MKELGVKPGSIDADRILEIFVRPGGREQRHPYQVFTSLSCSRDRCILEARGCPYAEEARKHPSTMAVIVGTVAGVLEALGYRVRWLATPSARRHACWENPPDLLVYMEPVEPPACRLIVEKNPCS
ncbi:hypothetical protein CF15_01125 [Pyrodictium occultum]|uniref:Uncharacterized protein n=1 Tax=Pyrodictium occultum TaxID=2309 RepID=A0A0V8RU63_PYROC|nr:hypothetical protein [Pyrodictium occultum]KSW11482.1 hypothetical protein CF15_01125 [Pyrodictium occultum]